MTNLQTIMPIIETTSFETQFTVISNFKILVAVLGRDKTIKQLVQWLQAHPDDARLVLERIQELADDKLEPGIMHSHDIHVVVYLYALNAADYPELALSAIEKIQETPGFYWAYKYAKHIRDSTVHLTKETGD